MKQHFFVFSIAWLLVCAVSGYAQDEGGSPIKLTTTLRNDGSRTDTETDIDKRTRETKTYDASKKLVVRCVYTLDDQGHQISGIMYDAKNVAMAQSSFKYDALGNVTEQINTTPKGVLLSRLVYIRDEKGRTTVAAYDAKGNLIQDAPGAKAPSVRTRGSRTR